MTLSAGEDIFVYRTNDHLLPKETILKLEEDITEKYIEIEWNPICDEDKKILEKVLVSFKDVTKLREARKIAQKHEEDLALISDIISIPPEHFSRFLRSANKYLSENIFLIERNLLFNKEVLKILFINIHTLKGLARSYHFQCLTEKCHLVEKYYAGIQGDDQKLWDRDRIIQDLSEISGLLLRYEKIAEEKLGRNNNKLTSTNIPNTKLIDCFNNFKTIVKSENNRKNEKEIEIIEKFFVEYLYQKPTDLLTELQTSAERLARDLKKDRPNVKLINDNVVLSISSIESLQGIFTHLLRNSLDHGFDRSEIREGFR